MIRPADRISALITAAVAAVLAFICFLQRSPAEIIKPEVHTLGPFVVEPVVNLYIAVGEDPVSLRLKLMRRRHGAKGDRILIRVFDPNDGILDWQFVEPGWENTGPDGGAADVHGREVQRVHLPKEGELFLDKTITLSGKPGIYELRTVAGHHNSTMTIESARPLKFGVCSQNGSMHSWNDDLKELFFHVPKDVETLAFIQRGNGELQVFDGTGKAHSVPKGRHEIPAGGKGAIWKVALPTGGRWELRMSTPIVFCPERAVAEQIRNSCEVGDDGVRIVFPAQKRLPKHIRSLWTPDKVGKAEDLIEPLIERREAWLKDPLRNSKLLGYYGVLSHIASILRFQDKNNGRLRPGLPENLAYAYSLDAEVNPYHGKTELLYRAVTGSLWNLYEHIQEDEEFRFSLWPNVRISEDPYPGVAAFEFGVIYFPVYALAAPAIREILPEVFSDWTNILRHAVDRHLPAAIATARNQSAHFPAGVWQFALGCGEPRYRDMARRLTRRFTRSLSPAGYMMENQGPETTYQGMTNFYMAKTWQLSKQRELLDVLRIVFRLLNHTVAPEPDGRLIGCSSFSHRTPGSYVEAQYGGGWELVGGELPEAGLWCRQQYADDSLPEARSKTILEQLEKPLDDAWHLDPKNYSRTYNSQIAFYQYLYWTPPAKLNLGGKTWPALEKKDFIRVFGDEFIAVKRPSYYTLLYVGQPAPQYYVRYREKHRRLLPKEGDPDARTWDFYGGKSPASPYTGGSLCLFWTPNYGTCISGYNWAPTVRHGLTVTDKKGLRSWEHYGKANFDLDKSKSTLRVWGAVEHVPLHYERRFQFLVDRIVYTLRLTADEDFEARAIVENFPIAFKKKQSPILFQKDEKEGKALSVTILNEKTQHGVRLSSDKAMSVKVTPNHTAGVGSVQVELLTVFKKGEHREWSFTLAPVRPREAEKPEIRP